MDVREVLIIGGGPAGLVAAIEIGRRGVPVTVLENDPGPPQFPKANATTSRTMEHFRRLGFADAIRARGLPEDYPQDITYFTRFAGHELARLPGRSRREASAAREAVDSRWPTPEPLHRVNQMFVEATLMDQARRLPAVDLRLGWRADAVETGPVAIRVRATGPAGAPPATLTARRVIGCDGPRSIVRSAIGGRYEGMADEERDFMGGRMMAVYLRSESFYSSLPAGRSWQYWAVNPERRGLICAIDGAALFVMHVQLARGETANPELARRSLALVSGREFAYTILGIEEWTAGFTLVADRYVDDAARPRLFLAGDSAHLFTPTGGQGYNTAVDDAVNLGWKMASVVLGWGGAGLLASYQPERQPIGRRNTSFARAMADSIGRVPVPRDIEDDSPAGAASRRELGARLLDHARTEFDIPGIHLGVCYRDSPVIAEDPAPWPEDDWHRYRPSGRPGTRAPHAWLADGSSLFDRFGRDFTLLQFGPAQAAPAGAIEAAARRLGIPLAVLRLDEPFLPALYGAELALIRPDQHVAWRAGAAADDPESILRRVTGRP